MTYPDGDDMLAGLDPTDEERLAFYEALDETEAEEAAGLPPEPPDGPWDDTAALGAIGGQLDARHALDGQRIGEDIVAQLDRRPTDEQRLARAMPRIMSGTYTEPEYSRGDPAAAAAARDPLGRWAAACGPLDDFGRCASRYHDPSCHTTTESAAARGSHTEVEAWNDTLAGRTPHAGIDAEALGLASPSGPEPGTGDMWGYVLDSGEPGSYEQLRARMLHELGEADPPPRELDPGTPDVTAVRAAMGI